MTQIKTVIFDMDGVIIDSEPVHMKIEQEIFRELGLDISMEEHQKYVGTSAHEMWEDVVSRYKLDIPADEILEKKLTQYLDYLTSENNLQPMESVRELITHLKSKGKQLILASSATSKEIDLVLDKLSLKSFFSHAISGAELERSKPNPAIFLKASSLAKTSPEQCCVIEDSQNGILAAKAAGMKCIGFRNSTSGNQDLSEADIIIDSFKDINIDEILAGMTYNG
jgi:HAD superfamily hydrolase (TIGR01509 family)